MKKATLENRLTERVKQKNGGQLPDERQQLFNSTVLACALVFGIVFDLIMMIYYFAMRNIDMAYPYVAQLVIMSVGCVIASFGSKDVQPPTILFSRRSVRTEKSARAFLSRLAWCLLDSLLFAVILTACDAYMDGKITGSILSDGVIIVCVFMLIESIGCEFRVHRYRKYMAMLDAEENDLSD